jgi:hypothetical protein
LPVWGIEISSYQVLIALAKDCRLLFGKNVLGQRVISTKTIPLSYNQARQ